MNRKDIYDDFKLKKTFGLHELYKMYFSALGFLKVNWGDSNLAIGSKYVSQWPSL